MIKSLALFAWLGVAPCLFAQAPSPAAPPSSATVAVAPAPADHQGSQAVQAEAADGTLLLHARDVSVHGTNVRWEPKPEKNTIGFWSRAEDWVSWQFELKKGGKFEVEILQGCAKGSGGSQVDLSVGGQTLSFAVEDTGSFHDFVARKLGTLTLPAGAGTLSVKPKNKTGVAVMDLRQVLLRRVQE